MHITRQCVFCRSRYAKDELIRYVFKENELVYDNKKLIDGRGGYLCKDCNQKIQTDSLLKSKVIYKFRKSKNK